MLDSAIAQHNPWLIALSSVLVPVNPSLPTRLAQVPSLPSAPVQSVSDTLVGPFTSFVEWCEGRDRLPHPERHTVDILLEIAQTDDCQTADLMFSQMTELDVSDRHITTLKPIASLTQLNVLRLGHNQISDIQPLSNLDQLTGLYLYQNQITDLQPLSTLNQLQELFIYDNQIQNLGPLSQLDALSVLDVSHNQITSIEALSNASGLTELSASYNQISEVNDLRSLTQLTRLELDNNTLDTIAPLTSLIRLEKLSLSDNKLTNIGPLARLTALAELDVRENPIAFKHCPVYPATVCQFSDDAKDQVETAQQQVEQGEFAAALITLQSALGIYQENGDRPRQVKTLEHIGAIYDELGEYANALDTYRQGLQIAEYSGDRQGRSAILGHLGQTYIRLGQFDTAITTLNDAFTTLKSLTASEISDIRQESLNGLILGNLALAYSKVGDVERSLRFAKHSLAHHRNRRGNRGERAREAIALNRVGQAYLKLGNRDKAQHYFDKALDRSQTWGDSAGYARSVQSLGDLAAFEGDINTALAYYQQAQDEWHRLDQPAAAGATLNAMGTLLLQSGDTKGAIASLQAAVDLWDSLRHGLTDSDKISIAETQALTYQLLEEALITVDDIETALAVSEQGRARAFAELLAHRLSLRGRSAPPIAVSPPSVDEIRTVAKDQNATLIEYAHHGDELYIWVVQPSGDIHLRRQSLQRQSLADWVNKTRRSLVVSRRSIGSASTDPIGSTDLTGAIERSSAPSSPRVDTTERLRMSKQFHPLYNLLIAPIADLLPPDVNAPVIIIPDAELFMVPFAALMDENQTYLIEDHALLFAPAISFLTQLLPSRPPLAMGQDTALVVGNPAMPPAPNTTIPLPSLAWAEQEALAIQPLLNTEPLIGTTATETAVRAALGEVAIAHFATHGLLDDFGTDMPGALALTPEPDGREVAASGGTPGFLTTAEISTLPLHAQLVVLSACNTGRGTITGDGVMGLSRSFLTAGVDNVVVSQWSVDDESTARLMVAFYRYLQEVSHPAIALRQAMLDIQSLSPYGNPFYWAAFSVFGRPGNSFE